MKTMMKRWGWALAVLASVVVLSYTADAKPSMSHDGASHRLTRRGAAGHIAVRSGRKHFPENAEVSIERARPDDVKHRIHEGWGRRHRKGAGAGAASPRRARLMAGSAPEASPKVLASYDIAIKSGGRKWQPDAGDPVQVTVELDEPVTVKEGAPLGVVHISDDGEVEELDPSRYGFVYDATKTAVTAFWFSAEGFSVYAITETETPKTDSTPARRLYDFYSLDFNTNSVTWNQYVRRYFTTMEGNTTFRQIVKDGEMLVRPEVLPSPLGRTFMGWHLYDPAKANSTVDGVTYDAEGYATTKFDFTQPIVFNPGETGENEYVLRTVFDHVGYVIFHEQPSGDDWPITAVRRGAMKEVATNIVVEAGVEKTNITMSASVPISDVTVTYDDTSERPSGEENANTTPRMIFRGWSTEKVMPGATTNVLGGPIELLGTNYVFTRTKDTEAVPRNLYPVFVNINWLAFSSGETGQGATYIPPHFFYADEGTNRFPVPSRTGYTFEGWYTSTNAPRVKVVGSDSNLVSTVTSADLAGWGGVISNGMLRLTKDTTLYANWTPAPTKYTVVVLRQSVEDDKDALTNAYDFAFSVTNIVPAESQVSVSNIYKQLTTRVDSSLNRGRSADEFITTADFKGFYYSGCDDTTTVKGNGTTVLRVYYDRYRVTYTFNAVGSNPTYVYFTTSNDGQGNEAGDSDSEYYRRNNNGTYTRIYYRNSRFRTSNSNSGTRYTGDVYVANYWNLMPGLDNSTMTGLYGQPLSMYGYTWPIDHKWMDNYSGSSATGTGMTYLDSFNAISYPQTTTNNTTHTITTPFFVDGNNGNSEIIHVFQDLNGNYSLDNSVTTYGSANNGTALTFNFTDKFEGFKVCGYTRQTFTATPATQVAEGDSASTQGYTLYVYHERRKFTLTFCDSYNLTPYSTVEVYYGAPLSAYLPSTQPSPTEPSMQAGYSFTGWYSDQATSTKFNFNTTMPRANLIAHAGWGTEWYLIEIDPNGGELMFVEEGSAANQSTFFWEPYNGDPIIEYTTVTRSFEESALYGTFFYAKKDRAYYGLTDEWDPREDNITSRRAYYTTSQSDDARVDDRRYRQAQNVYRYAGWYEQKEDGTEELYAFGQPVQKNTKLKLHWKHLGTYRLHYDVGTTGGRLSTGDENETVLETLDASVYADSSEILVTRTAIPPDGYAFVGWRIRYGDDTIYHPGQVFLFDAAYTRDVPGPDGKTIHQLVLDAVYTQVKTVALTTDANGGTLDGTVATTLPLAYPDAPSLITNVNDSATQRTVSGMRNNAYGHLSDGTGYSCTVDGVSLPFLGWNTAADGSGTHFDGGQYVGVDTLGTPDENGRNILYAEWGVLVYFDKNNSAAGWNAAAWPTNCVWDAEKGLFCQTNKLNGTATNPAVPLTSSNDNEMFRYWGIKRYSGEIEPYDFSTPITNASITLYGVWSNRIEVAVHAVDTTDGARTNKDADWLVQNHILMTADTSLSFETSSAGYADPGSGYAFMCANLANSHANVSEETMITNLYYNLAEQQVYVTYANGVSAPMPDDKEIYFVYFADPKEMDIAYRTMDLDGHLSTVPTTGNAPTKAVVTANGYVVPDEITRPLASANNSHKYFAYAIGKPDAASVADLHLITSTSDSDDVRPAFRLRNTCHGFQYSTDGGETWITYGFTAQLYVLYFDHTPVVVTFDEKTFGTAADMETNFTYTVSVSQTVVTNMVPTGVRTRTWSWRNWEWGSWSASSKPSSWTDDVIDRLTLRTTVTTDVLEGQTCTLKNGQQESFTIFSDDKSGGYSTQLPVYPNNPDHEWGVDTLYQTNYNVIVFINQTITITQAPKANFATRNDGVGGDQKYVYTYTATGADGEPDQRVTFTNTHIADTIPVHVALGENGSVSNRDDLRTSDASIYTMTVTNGTDNAVTFENGAPAGFFTGDATQYSFMGIFYARTNENGVVVAISDNPVSSVTFAPMGADGYFGLYFDGNPENAVGDWELYAVYAEMPRIYYVREGANGALSLVDPLTYQGVAVTNMGFGTTTVAQGLYATPNATNAFSVSTSPGAGKYFVPTFLDSLHTGNHLTQSSLAAGPVGATNKSAMYGVAEGSAIHLRVIGGILKWSADGATWGDFTGDPAVYVAYKEPGFDLTIVKASLASDADKAADKFTFTISSANLTNDVTYAVSGYSTEEVTPENGVITLIMTNGSRVTIHALPDAPLAELNRDRQYEILEQTAVDYTLTNTLVNGHTPSTPVANGVQTILYENKTVEFTNIKSYTVTFVDEDGTVISSDKVPYGTTPDEFKSDVDDPTKPMDETSIYRFDGWGPTVEPVGSNTTYTAEYTEIKIPQATQRQDDTNIVVNLDKETPQQGQEALVEALKEAGIDVLSPDYSEEAANEILNSVDPNGMRHWENLVTGSDTNALALSTASGEDDEATFHLTAGSDGGKYVDLGYIVLHDLRKLEDGRWNRKDGPKAGANPDFTIRLLDGEGRSIGATGLYRVYTLIIPKHDLAITNEIPSTNIVGVLEIESTMTNTLAAVPWHTLASDPANPTNISVSAWVQTNQLAGATYVRALDAAGGYQMWQLSDDNWMPFTTTRARNGGTESAEAEDAFSRRLRRGEPVWLTRTDVSKGSFFLIGQFSPDAVTEQIAGGDGESLTPTLLTNPTFLPMAINSLTWGGTPNAGDQILIPTEEGTPTILRWNGSNWGAAALVQDPTTKRWSVTRRTDFTIPPGRGFWYYRKATGGLSVTFPAIPCN